MWQISNQNLVAKAIGELTYEQILNPTKQREEVNAGETRYALTLKSGIVYTFDAWLSIWDHLKLRPTSIDRVTDGTSAKVSSAAQFFIDAQADLEMTDIILGNFLEEMNSTLYSDVQLLNRNRNLTVDEVVSYDGNKIQSILNGHPKILLNKGRMGWGSEDLARFAPENETSFQLFWIATSKANSTIGVGSAMTADEVMEQTLTKGEIADFNQKIILLNQNPADYIFIPVHPWQWEQVIRVQFFSAIANLHIVPLGLAGDLYAPQISIRTLSNLSHPQKMDIKLPLTILNTSAIRGIPTRYIAAATEVASAVARICSTDSVLKNAQTEVLQEKLGYKFDHPEFSKVLAAPYRYHEQLGVIFRESVQSKLKPGQVGILTASLFYQDAGGRSLIGAYIKRSELSAEQWLQRYFEVVVIPLYHLQLTYGLGLVSHGQNIMLKLENSAPVGIFLKDFQGDLRLSTESSALQTEFLGRVAAHLDKLPPDYLIHDLVTGHFVTVLRFISETMHESDGFSEIQFYGILAQTVKEYLKKIGVNSVDKRLDLFSPSIERVLVNKVRFKIGYADSADRPLPMLGTKLKNPLLGAFSE